MKIPSYEEAQSRVVEGHCSHLDWFIVENEPAGTFSDRFRRELANVIDEVVQQCHEDGRGTVLRFAGKPVTSSNEQQRRINEAENLNVILWFVVVVLFVIAFTSLFVARNCL